MNNRFSLRQLKNFGRLLENKKNQLLLTESLHEYEGLRQWSANGAGELSTTRRHQADSATRSFHQDLDLQLAEHENDEVDQILRALDRIDRGKYGQCVSCEVSIPEARLLVYPEAELCISCKEDWESELSSRQKPNSDQAASPFNPLIDQVQKREFV